MKRGRPQVDVLVYLKALPLMLRNPVIFVLPLLAAAVDLLVSTTSGMFTDPLGSFGAGIFALLTQIIYMFAFGVAVIQANNIWHNHRSGFDDAWEESRRKAGGIVLAAIGFQFIIFAAGYLGQLFGSTVQIGLELVAAIFLIFTIPAAAIGGLPGGLAISGSFRAVRANPYAAILLGFAFIVVWYLVPSAIGYFIGPYLIQDFTVYALILAAVHAIVLGYLAFPFAKIYDETAFRGSW